MNQNSYGGDHNLRSQYFEARQQLSQTELVSPQNRYRTINHPEVDRHNEFYGDPLPHNGESGYQHAQDEPVHQVQYYDSHQSLSQPYPMRASSYDEVRRVARHSKYKRDPATRKARVSSQNHNRSVKNSNLTKNLLNCSQNYDKKILKTDLNTSMKAKRVKRTNSKGNSRKSSGSKGQDGRNSRQSRAKRDSQKSRTISPAEFNGYAGSTNLRQPLTFIQQANSGSLGPPENRYDSQGRMDEIELENTQMREQMQLEAQNRRVQKSIDYPDSQNHVNSTAFFPGPQSYHIHDSNGQTSIDFSRHTRSNGMPNNFTGGPHKTPTLHYFSGQTNGQDMGYGQDTMHVLSSIGHAQENFNDTMANNILVNSTIRSDQLNKLRHNNEAYNDYNQGFQSGSKVLHEGSPLSPGYLINHHRGYVQDSYDPLNDTRQINKSYEDIRSNHQKSLGSTKGSFPYGDPQKRRQNSSKSSKKGPRQQPKLHNREVSFQQLGFKQGIQVQTMHRDSLDMDHFSGSQEESQGHNDHAQPENIGSPPVNHQMLAPRHQQITSDSLRNPSESKPYCMKSTSRSKSVDIPYSDVKRERDAQHLNHRNIQSNHPDAYRVRSSSPRYQDRSSRIKAASPQSNTLSHERNGRHVDTKSAEMSGSPRFSNHNGQEFNKNYRNIQSLDNPHLNLVDQEEQRQMLAGLQQELTDPVTSGRQGQSSAAAIGHFNTQDLVQLTSPDQLSDHRHGTNAIPQYQNQSRFTQAANFVSHTATTSGQAFNVGAWGSVNTGSGINTTKDARISEQIVHESQGQSMATGHRNDTFRDVNTQQINEDQLIYINSGHETPYLAGPHPKSPVTLMQQDQQKHCITEVYGPGQTGISSNIFSPTAQDNDNMGNFTMSDLNNTQMANGNNGFQNAINQPFQATQDIRGIYQGTIDSRDCHSGLDGTTLTGTGPQRLPQAIHSQNQKYLKMQLIQSEENLGKSKRKLVVSKFHEFSSRLWIRHRLQLIHETLFRTLYGGHGQRVDSYSSKGVKYQEDTSRLSLEELIEDIDSMSKKIMADVQQSGHGPSVQLMSRGLSKLSDIDSNFQISKGETALNPTSHQNQMQYLEQQSMNSYHNAINPNNVNQSVAFKTLNGQGSASTFRSKQDVDTDQTELTQLRRHKEDSEAIINNLRKTIKDMAKQMSQLEGKTQVNGKVAGLKNSRDLTPSLPNISASCHSTEEDKRANQRFLESQLQVRDMSTQGIQFELDQKCAEIAQLKLDHDTKVKQLKEKFRDKFNEQNQFIDELKTELNAAVLKNQEVQSGSLSLKSLLKAKDEELVTKTEDVARLENQVQVQARQMLLLKSQAACDGKTLEADKLRIDSAKEQEKHWKCGYETIFQKYTGLKEQLAKREAEERRLEWENDTKLKALTRRAEEAIRYFKDLALSRSMGPGSMEGPRRTVGQERIPWDARASRFQQGHPSSRYATLDESRATLAEDYKLRSRSAHPPPLLLGLRDSYRPSETPTATLTRQGHITPAREYVPTNRSAQKYREQAECSIDNPHEIQSPYRHGHKSHSPMRQGIRRSALPAREGLLEQSLISSREGAGCPRLSPLAKGRLNYIDKIQNELKRVAAKGDLPEGHDTRLVVALEALEAAFAEINQFKRETNQLSERYYTRHCSHLQEAQVLSYDYLEKIGQHLEREQGLKQELAKKDSQLESLRQIVTSAKRLILGLTGQIKDQKALKEAQWKNIISYDIVKDSETKAMTSTVREESSRMKEMITLLHHQLGIKDKEIEEKEQETSLQETKRFAVENSLSALRSTLEDTQQRLTTMTQQHDQLEAKLEQIEVLIGETLASACGVATREGHSAGQGFARGNSNVAVGEGCFTPGQGIQQNIIHSPDAIMDGAQPEAFQMTPDLRRADISTREVVLNRDRSQLYTNTKSDGESCSDSRPNLRAPPLLAGESAPRMPLEWLSQIRLHIKNLQERISSDAQYFDSLRKLVSGLPEKLAELPEAAIYQEGLDTFLQKQQNCVDKAKIREAIVRPHQIRAQNSPRKANALRNLEAQALRGGDTLTQSLESFIQNQGQPVAVNPVLPSGADLSGQHSYSQDLSAFAFQQAQQDTFGNFEGTEGTEALLGSDGDNGMQKSDEGAVVRLQLSQRLKQLLLSNSVNAQTILGMQQELERMNEENSKQSACRVQETQELRLQIQSLESEKEQLTQVYQQENQMRQELEVQVEEKGQTIEGAQKQVALCEEELEQLQEQQDKLTLEKEKLEQSNEYWQNSFKLIEQHFLEQKERADTDIANLTEQAALQDRELEERASQIKQMRDHIEQLQGAWLPVRQAREQAKEIGLQTEETGKSLAALRRDLTGTSVENEQIKRDIQVLIDSYENFKVENQRIQERQQETIRDLEARAQDAQVESDAQNRLVIERLNNEIQEQVAMKQEAEDRAHQHLQKLSEVEEQLRSLEQAKEEGELQLISQKDQIDQLTKFNEVVQSYNSQLQSQLQQAQVVDAKKALLSKEQLSTHSQALAQSQNTQMSPKYFVSSSQRGQYDSRGSQGKLAIPLDPSNSNLGSQSIGQFAGAGSFQTNPVFSPKIVEFVDQQAAEDQRRNSQFSFINGSRCREGSALEAPESEQPGPHEEYEGMVVAQHGPATGSHSQLPSAGAFSGPGLEPFPSDWQPSHHQAFSKPLSQDPSGQVGCGLNHPSQLNSLSGSQQTLPLNTGHHSSGRPIQMPLRIGGEKPQAHNKGGMPESSGPVVDISTIERVNNTSLGLDMCQSCIEHEVTSACQRDAIKRIVLSYVQLARRLTSMCMEGATLLRFNRPVQETIKVEEHSISSPKHNRGQSYDFNCQTMHTSHQTGDNLNLSVLSEPERKFSMIKEAQRFLEKDIEKFIGGDMDSSPNSPQSSKVSRRQERLLEYANELTEIAQHIVQNSCEIQLHHFGPRQTSQDRLGQSQSLKIRDYQSVGSVATIQQVDAAVQVNLPGLVAEAETGRSARIGCDTPAMEHQYSQKQRNAHGSALSFANGVSFEISQEIDELGVQLDNKIGIFVKLLMNLKAAQKKVKNDSTMTKLIHSLTGALSKIIHELTGDTEALYNIKTKLSACIASVQGSKLQSHGEPTDSRSSHEAHTARDNTASRESNMPLALPTAHTEGGVGQAYNGQATKSERTQLVTSPPQVLSMNFVGEDGRTVTDSQLTRSENSQAQMPQSISQGATPMMESLTQYGALSQGIVSSHPLHSDTLSGPYHETTQELGSRELGPHANSNYYYQIGGNAPPVRSCKSPSNQLSHNQQQQMMDETQGVETLINDISHLFGQEKKSSQAKTFDRKSRKNKSVAKRQERHSASQSPREYLYEANKNQVHGSQSKGTYMDGARAGPRAVLDQEENLSSLDKQLQQNKEMLKIIQAQQIYINTMSSRKESHLMLQRMSSQSLGPNQLHMVQSQEINPVYIQGDQNPNQAEAWSYQEEHQMLPHYTPASHRPGFGSHETQADMNNTQQSIVRGHKPSNQCRTPGYGKQRQEHKTIDFAEHQQNQKHPMQRNDKLNKSVSNEIQKLSRHHHQVSLRDPNIKSSQIYGNQSFFDDQAKHQAFSGEVSRIENVFNATNLSTISPGNKSMDKTLQMRFKESFEPRAKKQEWKENTYSSPSNGPTLVPTRSHMVSKQLPPRQAALVPRAKSTEHTQRSQENRRRPLKHVDQSRADGYPQKYNYNNSQLYPNRQITDEQRYNHQNTEK